MYLDQKDESNDNVSIVGLHVAKYTPDEHVIMKGVSSIAETSSPGSHAINYGPQGIAKANGYCAHAIALEKNSEAIAIGEESLSLCAGHQSKSIARGEDCHAIAFERDCLVASGKRGISIALGIGSTGMAGFGGVLALSYTDGIKVRLKVGYVGEDLQANTLYRVNSEGEFEVVEAEESPVNKSLTSINK
jgi:hypothetical protein